MPVKVTERNGGMASGIVRATVRFTLAVILLAAAAIYFVIR